MGLNFRGGRVLTNPDFLDSESDPIFQSKKDSESGPNPKSEKDSESRSRKIRSFFNKFLAKITVSKQTKKAKKCT